VKADVKGEDGGDSSRIGLLGNNFDRPAPSPRRRNKYKDKSISLKKKGSPIIKIDEVEEFLNFQGDKETPGSTNMKKGDGSPDVDQNMSPD
jgi:hypothetical protein